MCFQKSSPRFSEEGSPANLSLAALEHPSPISVLDTSIYRETEPSPVKTQGSKWLLVSIVLMDVQFPSISDLELVM